MAKSTIYTLNSTPQGFKFFSVSLYNKLFSKDNAFEVQNEPNDLRLALNT